MFNQLIQGLFLDDNLIPSNDKLKAHFPKDQTNLQSIILILGWVNKRLQAWKQTGNPHQETVQFVWRRSFKAVTPQCKLGGKYPMAAMLSCSSCSPLWDAYTAAVPSNLMDFLLYDGFYKLQSFRLTSESPGQEAARFGSCYQYGPSPPTALTD